MKLILISLLASVIVIFLKKKVDGTVIGNISDEESNKNLFILNTNECNNNADNTDNHINNNNNTSNSNNITSTTNNNATATVYNNNNMYYTGAEILEAFPDDFFTMVENDNTNNNNDTVITTTNNNINQSISIFQSDNAQGMLNITTDIAQTPPKKRSRKEVTSGRDGATIWKRPLQNVGQTNYHTIYLSENKKLSLEQNTKFFEIVAMLQLQQVQPFHMACEVVKNWNYQHSIYIPHNGIGFGGKMREGHAKKLFENIHTDIMRKNIVQQTATAPTTTTKKIIIHRTNVYFYAIKRREK